MASTYLSRTPASSGSSSVLTYSFWTKRSGLGVLSPFLSGGNSGTVGQIVFSVSDQLNIYNGASVIATTNAKFRDTSAWYHIVISLNSSETGTDKCKIWINGVQETSFATDNRSTFTTISQVNQSGIVQYVGSDTVGYVNGLMSHIHMVDGTAYDASAFGETDATTGIWKPKTAPSVTYGTNGFFLKFENSGSMGTDSSPNGNNFTVNGTMTQTVDTPSNVFATFNATKEGRTAASAPQSPTFSQGNTTASFTNTGNWTFATTTLAVSKGKWYAEMKCNTYGSYSYVGLNNVEEFGTINFAYLYRGDNGNLNDVTAYGSTWTTGDILQIAFDADNGTLWYGKNGTWQNSATQSEIENGTTTNAAASSIDMTKSWLFSSAGQNGSVMNLNTGNGYFGTTPVSSATSDESGLGIFEYTVPSGYYALCTKNINEQEYA